MEFHIARSLREELQLDEQLFSYAGNVVFANIAASRGLAAKLTAFRDKQAAAKGAEGVAEPVNAGALFAMGFIDELNHALIARYRQQVDPSVLSSAVAWLAEHASEGEAEKLLLAFAERFPNTAVYRGELTAKQWLQGRTEDLSHSEVEFEELLLLWLANINPAFRPFCELFDDTPLRTGTHYARVTGTFPEFFSTRPPLSPEVGSLLDALRAPMIASPDSLTGQLEFIREHWAEHIDMDLRRLLLAVDTVREEDLAIWMRFHPPGPDWHRHGAFGGPEGFRGDEYVGFDEFYEWVDGKRILRKRYATDYQAPLNEYEAFSTDQAWMPTVVMMAKSTYVWLEQLSKKYGRHIHRLDHVPDEELKLLAGRGMTALWLIGLWERSLASRTIKHLRGQHDAVASAYSLKRYDIAEDLGGNQAYEDLRNRAARFGLRLASDMVPNHMGIDADWVIEHPDWFLYRDESPFPSYSFNGPDLSTDSRVEIKIEDHYYDQSDAAVVFRLRHHAEGRSRFVYHGNDGTTFAWNDTAQIDYSKAGVREQVMQAILHVARMFPIIRFDAAMVLAKRHVQRLWFPLPGAGGSIPSRAENALTQEEFDAIMPQEFWREVVDRVAVEVPGTLLLAEAFWMLEGYFVRTLGMHRVYNSAFMNMLRDEENAKYRNYLKKTIEFDPDILKRYVNFMSNPDERTAIDQFGTGDKCFGVATVMATMPGLPMFGHGQIEGYTERYGMEFKAARMNEWPNEGLMARHQQEIAPLLKRRYIFAESANFVLYDFWTGFGMVNENVFAYSNRFGDQRSLVLYNNAYVSTGGTIHVSVASMDKGSGELRQRSLAEGLGIGDEDNLVYAFRDHVHGLEYLRRAADIRNHGLHFDLRGYQYDVLLDWRELRSTAEYPWDRLCDGLNGAGVYSVDEAIGKLRLRPLHEALRQALGAEFIDALAELSREPEPKAASAKAGVSSNGSGKIPAAVQAFEQKAEALRVQARELLKLASVGSLAAGSSAPEGSDVEGSDAESAAVEGAAGTDEDQDGGAPALVVSLPERLQRALALPRQQSGFTTVWPAAAARVLPSLDGGPDSPSAWAPILALLLVEDFAPAGERVRAFDEGQLRSALAEIFSSLGIEVEAAWRKAAGVGVALRAAELEAGHKAESPVRSQAFWNDSDVRWLTGVNGSGGKTYVNKERFEELLTWLQVPTLLEVGSSVESSAAASSAAASAAHSSASSSSAAKAEEAVGVLCREMAEAGYELAAFLWAGDDEAPESDGEARQSTVEALPVESTSKADGKTVTI